MPPREATALKITAYSGRFGLWIAKTSPLRNPRRSRPAAARRIPSRSCPYVMVRPLGPSISAGLSPSRSAWRSTYSVMETSGIVTAALVLLVIMVAPSSDVLALPGSLARSSRHSGSGAARLAPLPGAVKRPAPPSAVPSPASLDATGEHVILGAPGHHIRVRGSLPF